GVGIGPSLLPHVEQWAHDTVSLWSSAAKRRQVLQLLPRGLHARVARRAAADSRAASQEQCADVHPRLRAARQARAAPMRALRARRAGSSRGLLQAPRCPLALPCPPSRASPPAQHLKEKGPVAPVDAPALP